MSINSARSSINSVTLHTEYTEDNGQLVEVAVTHNNSNHICHAMIYMPMPFENNSEILGALAVKYCGLTNDHDDGIS